MARRVRKVVVLGGGYTGAAVLVRAIAAGLESRVTVRRPEAAPALVALGARVLVMPELGAEIAEHVDLETHVVVTFPPDGATDARVADAIGPAGGRVAALTYLSASSVYGARRGVIDAATPTTETPTGPEARRLEAEAIWRARGATVLRCPAIYGEDRGLHVRVLSGAHRIPGDGSGWISRIHVEDLAALVLASPRAPGETFVVGDDEPAPHREVVAFICAAHGVPLPPAAPLEEVHPSLRGDRRIDGREALARLGVSLRYPSYRAGMLPRSR
jgi:nucleoside-diphosphate-sugar epimerase